MSDADLAAAISFALKREPWMDFAACKGLGPKLFFPDRGQSLEPAKRFCCLCPVASECLSYRDRSGSEHGIWGGKLLTRSEASDVRNSRTKE